MTFRDIALRLIARGWHVHPLAPRTKQPITAHGKDDASTNEAQVRAWWTRTPNANIGIACGPSQLAVLDCDHGLNSEEDFIAWRDRNALPITYTVRTGRRDSFGVQMYYGGPMPDVGAWKLDGCSGQVKSLGGYVCAAGSVHPDTGETYQVLVDAPLAPTPELVRKLQSEKPKTGKAGQPITENRNINFYNLLCKWRNDGMTEDGLIVAGLQHNADMVIPPMDEDEVRQIARNAARHDVPEPVPEVFIGSAEEKTVTDWREHYHTVEAHDSVGPPEFLIDSFLQRQAIMGLGAFVGQKKTLLALNIVRSLCSGEPLFGKFEVTRQPTRVLYLGPENGMISFSNRVNSIGLRPYLGKTFFYTTMSMEKLPLLQLTPEEIQGAAIFIDTMIRYTDGNENDAAQMKTFAELTFSLIRGGAESVVVLHHSPKAMTKAGELSLDNAFRGSGELTAFLSVALALRTQDMNDEYGSASLIRFVKQRDFEPKPASFEVTTDRATCLMAYVDGSNGASVLKNPGNADGRKAEALQVIRDNPTLSLSKLVAKLAEHGIKRSKSWAGQQHNKMFGTGVMWTKE